MLILISPAKKLNEQLDYKHTQPTFPEFLAETNKLLTILKKFSASELSDLMKLSNELGELNQKRYQKFAADQQAQNKLPAVLAFAGEVYNGLQAESFNESEANYATEKLRILSGLYGILKPYDLIEPYRLEMGTALANPSGKNLYDFWDDKICNYLNAETDELIVNLASTEYFKVTHPKQLNKQIITPIFKDEKNGTYKTIMMYAKKARGAMARYIIQNQLNNLEQLKQFKELGYRYNQDLSELDNANKTLVFTR